MNLCQVAGAGGGADRIILRTAEIANPDKLKVMVCCLRRMDDEKFDFDDRAKQQGVPYFEIQDRSKLDRDVLPTLRRLIRQQKVQILHAHGYKAVFYASRIARLDGVIPMSTSHGWTGYSWRERLVYYPLERLLARRFSALVAVSSQIRSVLIRWGANPDTVHVVLNGALSECQAPTEDQRVKHRESLGIEPNHFLLGAVGRLEKQKRFDLLLQAARTLLTNHPNVRLLIAGEGSLRNSLQRQITRLGLEHACQLLGHRHDISDLYHAFDVVVQSSDYEGTPTILVEAMAAGTPIVATDAGGTSELLDDDVHGLVVPRRNIRELVAAIESVIKHPKRAAKRAAAAGKRVATDLSFATRTARLSNIYEKLVDRHNS